MKIVLAFSLVVAAIVLSFLFRYQLVSVGNQSHRIDRFTGKISICDDRGCRPIEQHSAESWKAAEGRRKTETASSAAESSARVEKRSSKERRQEDRADKESKNKLDDVRERISDALKQVK